MHALGLSVCCGWGPRATQIKRSREWKRGGHPGHTDKAREREGGRLGGRERNEGKKANIRYWLGVHLSIFASYEL